MPPPDAGGGSAAEGGADNGGGLPAPPLAPVLPASLQPVSAISASTTKAMLVSAKALEIDVASMGREPPRASEAGKL